MRLRLLCRLLKIDLEFIRSGSIFDGETVQCHLEQVLSSENLEQNVHRNAKKASKLIYYGFVEEQDIPKLAKLLESIIAELK